MRTYGAVHSTFWTGATGKAMRGDFAAYTVASYLITCRHANMIGIYNLPLVYPCHEIGMAEPEAIRVFAKLETLGFAFYDHNTETVWVPRMAAFQVGAELGKNDKRRFAIVSLLGQHKGHFVSEFFRIYGEAYKLEAPPQGPTNAPSSTQKCPSEAPSMPLASPLQAPPKGDYTGTGSVTGTGTGQEQNSSRTCAGGHTREAEPVENERGGQAPTPHSSCDQKSAGTVPLKIATDTLPVPVGASELPLECEDGPAPPASPQIASNAFLTFRVKAGKDTPAGTWDLTHEYLAELVALFGCLDVPEHCRRALLWTGDKPANLMTEKGMRKFLRKWLDTATKSLAPADDDLSNPNKTPRQSAGAGRSWIFHKALERWMAWPDGDPLPNLDPFTESEAELYFADNLTEEQARKLDPIKDAMRLMDAGWHKYADRDAVGRFYKEQQQDYQERMALQEKMGSCVLVGAKAGRRNHAVDFPLGDESERAFMEELVNGG